MSVESVIIKSARGVVKLRLSDPRPPSQGHPVSHLRAALEDRDIPHSSANIFIYEPYDLAAFFDDLAAHGEGREGERSWWSVEKDLTLTCRAVGAGLVAMEVVLRSGPWEDDWRVQIVIYIEAGRLDQIAAHVRGFLHAGGAS